MACMAVPSKYKQIGDFHEYYSGARVAPYLTVFVGGNHEASNYLSELHHGGWVAPNIYYLGTAGVIRCGPLRIAGMSGIWKAYNYRRPHFERLPYSEDDKRSIYHVRELDVRKMLQIRTQVDLGISHDWPRMAAYSGDTANLLQRKPFFSEDIAGRKLGSVAAQLVLERVRPSLWFSAHLHCGYVGTIRHENQEETPNMTPVQATRADAESVVNAANVAAAPKAALDPTLVPAPETGSEQQRPEVVIAKSDAISAWQQFYQVAAKEDKKDNDRFQEARAEHRRRVQAGELDDVSRASYNTTWKQVSVDQDGLQRHITKTSVETQGTVKNTDEIDLDLDSASETSIHVEDKPKEAEGTGSKNVEEVDLTLKSTAQSSFTKIPTKVDKPPVVKNTDEIDLALDSDSEAEVVETPTSSKFDKERASDADVQMASTLPMPETRNSAPDESDSPTTTSKLDPQAPSFVAVEENTPLPTDITNTTTHFLALDKCGRGRHFIQLIALPVISEPGLNRQQAKKRQFQLEYDKEWLAITRVFADELVLGDQHNPVPADKGEAAYRREIQAAEEWVEENIVKQGKMVVPHNFTMTAPPYNPTISVRTEIQPPEYANPQTAEFCDLIGITNKFHRDFEQRQAQSNAIHEINKEKIREIRGQREQRAREADLQLQDDDVQADEDLAGNEDIILSQLMEAARVHTRTPGHRRGGHRGGDRGGNRGRGRSDKDRRGGGPRQSGRGAGVGDEQTASTDTPALHFTD